MQTAVMQKVCVPGSCTCLSLMMEGREMTPGLLAWALQGIHNSMLAAACRFRKLPILCTAHITVLT